MNHRFCGGTALAIGVGIGLAAYATAQLGPLDPPPGPVTDTSPSLGEIESKIDALQTGQSGEALPDGPFQVLAIPETGLLTSNLSTAELVTGPVYVHSITAYNARVVLFDGPGQINSSGNRLAGRWVARNNTLFSAEGDGRGPVQPVTVPVRQEFQDGLHAAWQPQDGDAHFYILYTELQETP